MSIGRLAMSTQAKTQAMSTGSVEMLTQTWAATMSTAILSLAFFLHLKR